MAIGAVVAMTAVLLAFQLGGTRVFFAMARDGLLPPAFARVHPRFRTPYVGTIITGIVVSMAPSLLTESQALELTNIGTLFAFVLVSIGVIVLRKREPDRPRPFKVPGYPVTPLLSAGCCILLMLGLPASNWWRFGIWLAIGLAIYFAYGRKRSRLAVGRRVSMTRRRSPGADRQLQSVRASACAMRVAAAALGRPRVARSSGAGSTRSWSLSSSMARARARLTRSASCAASFGSSHAAIFQASAACRISSRAMARIAPRTRRSRA